MIERYNVMIVTIDVVFDMEDEPPVALVFTLDEDGTTKFPSRLSGEDAKELYRLLVGKGENDG